MSRQLLFLLLFISSAVVLAQCPAATAGAFAGCLPSPNNSTIAVSADMNVPGPLNLSGVTVDIGNMVNLTLPAETVVNMTTSFTTQQGNTDLTVIVGGTPYTFGKNGSPNLDDLNDAINPGGATTLGNAALAANGILPVSLLSFEAQAMDKKVMLTWTVAEESGNEAFELSVSSDGVNFQPLKTVAGRGDAVEVETYEVSDVPVFSGDVYYRLTQRDFSGVSRELGVRTVRWEADAAAGLSVFPNPSSAGQMVRLRGVEANTTVDLLGMNGQLVRQLRVSNGQTMVPGDVAAGVYLLRATGVDLKPVRLVIK